MELGPNKKTARLAGLVFLLMVVFGLASELFFRQRIFVVTDIVATANNVISNTFLYRVGILSDMLMTLCYLLTALVLYKLLSPVNKSLAATMVLLATAGSVLLLINVLTELAPLYILTESDFMSSFSIGQKQALTMFFYNLYLHGYMIGQIFFALWVLPLGVLIYKSKFIPKAFGLLFMLETFTGLLSVAVHFLVPNVAIETILMLPMMIAEFGFMFYLLIRGINESKLLK